MKGLLSLGMVIKLGAGTLCLIGGVLQVVGLLLLHTCTERLPRVQVFCVLCWSVKVWPQRKYRKKKFYHTHGS